MVSRQEIQKHEALIRRIDTAWNNPRARDKKWSGILRAVETKGIRGLSATIKFKWPIVVIGGTNRSGKTTFLQVCSMAYKELDPTKKERFAGYRWFPASLGDETDAINLSSYIHFKFWDESLDYEILSKGNRLGNAKPGKRVSRLVMFRSISKDEPPAERHHFNRWGWKRQRERHFKADSSEDANYIVPYLNYILGSSYDGAKLLKLANDEGMPLTDIPLLTKDGISYTDRHMGAGEHKIFRLVYDLEKLLMPSLILLEEPEVTLHPEVHWRLALYLIDLCDRGRHQIILTTHSPALFRVFPPRARIFLSRGKEGVKVEQDAEPLRVERELSGSVYTNKDLVLVEDKEAKFFLQKILEHSPLWWLSEQITIVDFGGWGEVEKMIKSLNDNDVRAVGVRDPEVPEDPTNKLISLPGGDYIECILLDNENLKRASSENRQLQDTYDRARSKCVEYTPGTLYTDSVRSKHHKAIMNALSSELDCPIERLLEILVNAWLRDDINKSNAEKFAVRLGEALKRSTLMSTVSKFYGMDIQMYFNDKYAPHFHAIYEKNHALISIADCTNIVGGIPQHATQLVHNWWKLHRAELEENWKLASRWEELRPIEGLK